MPNDPPNGTPTAPSSLVDAVYDVALDPGRYDELVAQWRSEVKAHEELLNEPEAGSSVEAARIADHFRRATAILERIHTEEVPVSAAGDSVASPSATLPEVMLSATGQVLRTNFSATALLSAQTGQMLDRLDLSPATQAMLLEQCGRLRSDHANPGAKADPKASKVLRINRLDDNRPLVVLLSTATFSGQPVLTLRCTEIVWPETLSPLLNQAFSLTSAECEIVQALVEGRNVAEIADDRGTSRQTVRTQIRQLLAKTETHSQLELIRMAIGFSMMSQQAEARAGRLPQYVSTKATALTDGSDLPDQARSTVQASAGGGNFELVQYGPDDGPPVLVFHDEVIGDAFVLPLLRHAPGYRWLVAVRPGYGATSLQASRSPEAAWQAQVSAFHQALTDLLPDLAQAPVLAQGNGIFFACQFARTHPHLCDQITAIAASLPGKVQTSGASRYAEFMEGMSRLAPATLRFAVQAGFAMYARVGPRRFIERVYGDSACDREIITSGRAMADLEHGSRLTLAQGYRGFLADEQALRDDWSDDLIATPVPIQILIGDEDRPVRRQRAIQLRARSDSIDIIEIERAGFFAAFSATQAVNRALFKR